MRDNENVDDLGQCLTKLFRIQGKHMAIPTARHYCAKLSKETLTSMAQVLIYALEQNASALPQATGATLLSHNSSNEQQRGPSLLAIMFALRSISASLKQKGSLLPPVSAPVHTTLLSRISEIAGKKEEHYRDMFNQWPQT